MSDDFFFFNDTATTEIYTLSLHDALPIFRSKGGQCNAAEGDGSAAPRFVIGAAAGAAGDRPRDVRGDRKSTRLNSSHANISYAVFCLKKKKIPIPHPSISRFALLLRSPRP